MRKFLARKLIVLLLLMCCTALGGCQWPWMAVFRTTPETRSATASRAETTQPTRKTTKMHRIIIRKATTQPVQEVRRER